MLISRLSLKNFACFPEQLLEFTPLTVLVGPNDSGKTTLLRALQAFQVYAASRRSGGGDDRPLLRLGMEHPRWSRADGPMELRIAMAGPGHGELVLCSQGDEGQVSSVEHPLSWAAAEGGLDRIAYVRFHPDRLRAPSPALRAQDIPHLAEDGHGLPTLLSALAGADWERLGRIRDELRAAIPTLSGFSVLPREVGGLAGHRLVFRTRYDDIPLEASQVSDGVLLFLGYLALLHHPSPPPLLLIEEPETGVHPSRLSGILRLFRRLAAPTSARPGVQIVLTTHSPYLLDEVQPEEAWFCHRGEDGAARATRFDEIPQIGERLKEYMLGELWTAYGEGRLFELVRPRQSAK